MAEADFDTITTIAAERNDISIFLSSTPTGKRGKFYQACTNKAMGLTINNNGNTITLSSKKKENDYVIRRRKVA